MVSSLQRGSCSCLPDARVFLTDTWLRGTLWERRAAGARVARAPVISPVTVADKATSDDFDLLPDLDLTFDL